MRCRIYDLLALIQKIGTRSTGLKGRFVNLPIANLVPYLLHHLTAVCQVSSANPGNLAMFWMRLDYASMTLKDLDEFVYEFVDVCWSRATTFISRRDDTNTPGFEWTIFVVQSEFAAGILLVSTHI